MTKQSLQQPNCEVQIYRFGGKKSEEKSLNNKFAIFDCVLNTVLIKSLRSRKSERHS